MSRRVLSVQQAMAYGQIPMFMTGSEIKEHIGENTPDKRPNESIDEMWERKKKESQVPGSSISTRKPEKGMPSLEESIKEKGFDTFVRIMPTDKGDRLLDGHHRVAAAANVDPKMLIPIKWHEKNVEYEK